MAQLVFGMSADQVNLSEIADLVSRYGVDQDWDDLMVMKVNLLLEELVLNVQDYGERPGRRIEVYIVSEPGRVCLNFSDDGVRFDPTSDAPAPDLESGVDERRVGGLGVHLVRMFADDVAYRYEGGRNLLSLAFCA